MAMGDIMRSLFAVAWITLVTGALGGSNASARDRSIAQKAGPLKSPANLPQYNALAYRGGTQPGSGTEIVCPPDATGASPNRPEDSQRAPRVVGSQEAQ
jgi:hypothetical protein